MVMGQQRIQKAKARTKRGGDGDEPERDYGDPAIKAAKAAAARAAERAARKEN